MQLTYFGMLGHESCNLIKYLEGYGGVTPIKRGHNPATWMLEVTGGATSTGIKPSQLDFPAVYKVTHYDSLLIQLCSQSLCRTQLTEPHSNLSMAGYLSVSMVACVVVRAW